MAPILYVFPPSPAARSVLMTAKAIGLNLQVKPLDFFKGEHLTPEYLEMNPQHTVPTLVDDDGFTFWDSHAINAYLVSRYAKSDDLYPRDIKRRGVVNQRLHFDSGVASTTGSRVIFGILNDSKTSVDQEDVDNVNQVYAWLDEFLKGKLWMAGDSVTIADYNLFASTTNLNIIVPIDAKKYPRVAAWVKKLESRPEAEGNKKGLALLVTMVKSKLSYPPVRAVLMTVEAIGKQLDLKEVNFTSGDHLNLEFLKRESSWAYLDTRYVIMAWLSHTENPSSSTRVGTVCCGLIYKTNTRNRMRRVLIIHLEEFRFEMLARHQVYLSLDQVEPQSISCDQDGSNRRTRYDHSAPVLRTMAPTVYMVHPSPPVRAVLMTAKAIGLELDLKEINLVDGDHLKPEFLKINPQHTVPTLVEENGQVLWDSHAIMTYLVSKYGDKESLYPKDFFKRAVVDQRLHFESGLVFPRVLKIVGPIVRAGKKTIDQEDIDAAHGIYAFLETFLDGKKWIAGSHVTVADYSLISSISTLNVLVNIDEEKFPRVAAWVRKVEGLGEYAANKKGLDIFKEMIRIKMS
ncbi:uncharacterized protein [Tenebrio molitor]|uniref:uncharacterized protein n=1 Tax=Tenebrio molitor TaxID=7067 RepID=UPI0036247053